MKKINITLLLTFLLIITSTYIFEVIYYLPSPTGDGVQFLKVSFNICRYDTFIQEGSHAGDRYISHGWFLSYLKAILNLDCKFGFIFLFNFLLKLITIFFAYLLLKDKIYQNYLLIFLVFIFVIQLKLQFRPENFALMLSTIIIYLNERKFYKFVPIFFAFLFYSHFIFFSFLALFFIIYFHKTYFKFKIFIESILIFAFTLFILDLIYPYNLIDYLEGMWANARIWTRGTYWDIWPNFVEYYLITKIHGGGFFPLFGIIFFLVIFILLNENKLFFLAIPFLYYFSLRNMPGNYYMFGLTPILFYLSINFNKKKYIKKSKIINILFSFILLVTIVGYSQYFVKNILTIKYYKDDYESTLNFIDNNLDKIDRLPSFAFLVNNKIRLENYGIKNCQNCNKLNSKKEYNIREANGNKNPCPDDILNNKDFSIKFFGKKIFNSNSGYGIYICGIN
tara:strand:- start:3025 stop:4377 length:1353 start_codon:yes stop_codon:yes gene_type:complete